ncbi:MAG TPA: CopG family antitoxin [Xanthomonadales bacterium]|nr:CopG family antitoxin [Xanthomonadales bacterium]
MKKKLKLIPKFKNEDEERDFWATADTSEYFDWNKAEEVIFPNLNFQQKPFLSGFRRVYWQ